MVFSSTSDWKLPAAVGSCWFRWALLVCTLQLSNNDLMEQLNKPFCGHSTRRAEHNGTFERWKAEELSFEICNVRDFVVSLGGRGRLS